LAGPGGDAVAPAPAVALETAHLPGQLGRQQELVAVLGHALAHRGGARAELVLRVDGPGEEPVLLAQEPPLHAHGRVPEAAGVAGLVAGARDPGRFQLELDAPAHAVVDVEARLLGAALGPHALAEHREVDLP